jgi:hypothetical protein
MCASEVFQTVSSLCGNPEEKIYKTIILPVASYGYEVWSLLLIRKLGLWLSENKVLKGPGREETAGGGVTRHLYSSPGIEARVRHVARMR